LTGWDFSLGSDLSPITAVGEGSVLRFFAVFHGD
jgi:hypothetical protein